MLKGLTNTFKTNCNKVEVALSEYLVLDNTTIPIKAQLDDDCYENGNFIGTFIFKTIRFETDATYDFKNKEFEYYKVVDNESIKIGTFITTDVEINDTTDVVKVVGMDYGLKTQVEYSSTLDYISGEITLLDVWNECCTLSGLTSGINSFPNDDFIVENDQFTGNGATIRDVFKAIAISSGTFVKVMNDDNIYLVFTEATDEVIEDYVELQDKRDTHPWTCLRLGSSQIDGENVDYIDEELVEEYGEHWLILNDNPFAYTQEKKQALIPAIFNQIKEFGYSAFTSKTSFKPYLTCGDVIQFRNRDGDLVNSIVLRYNHNFEDIEISAPSETSATINYVYPLSAVQIAKNTQIEVDKANQTITSIVEKTEQIDVNEQRINDLAERTNSVEETITSTQETIEVIQREVIAGQETLKNALVTIDINGINVSTNTSAISTLMTNDTFEIRASGYTDPLAYFGYDTEDNTTKAEMDNLTVTNYLVTGYHRIQTWEEPDMNEPRTGFFWIGE